MPSAGSRPTTAVEEKNESCIRSDFCCVTSDGLAASNGKALAVVDQRIWIET